MNKIYAILFLSLFASLSASAQLSGNGYYRIKNKATGKYATLASNEMSYEKVVDGIGGRNLLDDTNLNLQLFGTSTGTPNNPSTNGAYPTVIAKMGCYLENDIRQVDDGALNTASVFYLEKNGNQYNLKGEGTDLKTITNGQYSTDNIKVDFPGFYTNIKSVGNNLYNIYIPVSASTTVKKYITINATITVGDYYFCDNAGTFGVEKDASTKEEAQWYIEPATTFNVKPLEKVKDNAGHYYTTLCVNFPFSIPSTGSTVLAAYTVTGKDAEGNAVLNQLSGVIPGGTPVILECSSSDEATNVLNIETTAPANKGCADGAVVSSDGNCLQGRYFNAPAATYKYKNYLNQVSNPTTANFTTDGNKLTNDKNYYRVLNCVAGVVGFYKLKSETATMGANKAFLNIKDMPEASPVATAKRFSIETSGETTAITDIHQDAGKNEVIYDLQGRRVEHPSRHGIYIVNGKKVVY